MRTSAMSKAAARKEALEALSSGMKWLREYEAAGYLGLAPYTLRKWRLAGKNDKGEKPPRAYKRGEQTFYKVSELDEWIEAGLIEGKSND